MPPGAAAFAVRDAGKADFLLLGDQTPDRFVLDGFELACADLALLALGARLLHFARAQQAAHMIGAKGRDRALHGMFLVGCRLVLSTRLAQRQAPAHRIGASSSARRSRSRARCWESEDMTDSEIRIAHGGKSIYGAKLGILMLEARFPRIPGDMGNAGTWPFPVLYKVVRGASPHRVVRQRAKGLLDAFLDAARELVELGADGITTNCGFLSLYQAELCFPCGRAGRCLEPDAGPAHRGDAAAGQEGRHPHHISRVADERTPCQGGGRGGHAGRRHGRRGGIHPGDPRQRGEARCRGRRARYSAMPARSS